MAGEAITSEETAKRALNVLKSGVVDDGAALALVELCSDDMLALQVNRQACWQMGRREEVVKF